MTGFRNRHGREHRRPLDKGVEMNCADLATLPHSVDLSCDLCIVGSGPAGATLAKELSSSSLRVTLIESGGLTRNTQCDQLNEIENVGWTRTSDQWLVRNRIFGGSSHTWFGRSVSYDDIDFEHRSWVPYSGWPFAEDDLAPYLERSAKHLGLAIGTGFSDETFWAKAGRPTPQPALDDSLLPCFWQFSQDYEKKWDSMRFGRHLLNQIGANVRVVINATVVDVLTNDAADAVTGVTVASPDGTRRHLHAKVVVLCAGGLENARLLLISNSKIPAGLGNGHDQVGRYLMDHLRGNLATFNITGSDDLQKQFGYYRVLRHNFLHGMRLNPRIQRDEELLNVSAWVAGDLSHDDPWEAVKRILRQRAVPTSDLVAIAKNLPWLISGAAGYLFDKVGLPHRLDQLNLLCMCEQIPDPESRISLAQNRDRYEIPLLQVHWKVHELERRSLCRMAELVARAFSKAGLPTPHLEEWVTNGDALPKTFGDVAHPIGTTRMGIDPSTSVVDVNAKVHGIEGLFVAGSSVFPTSSHANPTLMIVAMSIRLADELKRRMHQASMERTNIELEAIN